MDSWKEFFKFEKMKVIYSLIPPLLTIAGMILVEYVFSYSLYTTKYLEEVLLWIAFWPALSVDKFFAPILSGVIGIPANTLYFYSFGSLMYLLIHNRTRLK